MTTLIYSQGDFAAADIAIKVQALAAGQGQKIASIPKHYGRNDENADRIIGETDVALLIVRDAFELDARTFYEVSELARKGKPIVAIIPPLIAKQLKGFEGSIDMHVYEQEDAANFYETMDEIIESIKNTKKEESNQKSLMTVAAVLVLVILLFGILEPNE